LPQPGDTFRGINLHFPTVKTGGILIKSLRLIHELWLLSSTPELRLPSLSKQPEGSGRNLQGNIFLPMQKTFIKSRHSGVVISHALTTTLGKRLFL